MASSSDAPSPVAGGRPGRAAKKKSARESNSSAKKVASRRGRASAAKPSVVPEGTVSVRRYHPRDSNRVWEFLKQVFRVVNRETVEYQRPRSKRRFEEVYEQEGIEQLVFEMHVDGKNQIVAYTECAFQVTPESWINARYFSKRDMRPLFVEELAVHPEYQGRGIGAFVLEQLEHLARVRGCTHLVLEVAENNKPALGFYRTRKFYKLDAGIFLAKRVSADAELLPPRRLRRRRTKKTVQPEPGRGRST